MASPEAIMIFRTASLWLAHDHESSRRFAVHKSKRRV
jgi:hypothetical protein